MKTKYMVMALACAVGMGHATKIGVLKRDASFKCPGEQVYFDLDVEDSNNDTKIMSLSDKNDRNIPGISLGGHAQFTYCVIDSDQMLPVSFDYVVLRMDNKCPSGATAFSFTHDTENSRNRNSVQGNVSPSVINRDIAKFEYCFVPKSSSPKAYYPFKNVQYGVFANRDDIKKKDNIKHYYIKIDDEDDRNRKVVVGQKRIESCRYEKNGKWYDAKGRSCSPWEDIVEKRNYNDSSIPSGIKDALSRIMTSGDNTFYNVIKWSSNSTSGILAKSVDALDASVSAMPVSATIRGLDRSNITVELQTAGNAKISVMNVNGAVVANIAQENLMPGVHQVKWNSGIVPNGVYIVKVVHNGMVNSKRVILK